MPSLKHIQVGDPITADLLNRIADRLEPWSKMTVAQGSHLNFMTGPFGKTLALMLPREIPARLIGSSSPYAWTALTEEADGAYADRTGGLLGGDAAYEINGKANLDGKVVMLRWTAAGDWRFQWVGYGPCVDSQICVTVTGGCDGNPVSATVTVTQGGVTIGSCVTSGNPETCCVALPDVGTYDVEIAADGYDTETRTVAALCATNSLSVVMTTKAGCCNGCPKLETTETPYVTDANGTHAMTYSSTDLGWVACYNFTSDLVILAYKFHDAGGCGCFFNQFYATGTVGVKYVLTCTGGVWKLSQEWLSCQCTQPAASDGTCPPTSTRGYQNSTASFDEYGCRFTSASTGDPETQPACGLLGESYQLSAADVDCSPFSLTFNYSAATFDGLPVPSGGPALVTK